MKIFYIKEHLIIIPVCGTHLTVAVIILFVLQMICFRLTGHFFDVMMI